MPTITSLRVDSAVAGQELEAPVYLPPGFDPSQTYPVLYVHAGHFYFKYAKLPEWLDTQVQAGMAPCIAVAPPEPDEPLEAWLPGTAFLERFGQMIVSDLALAVERNFATGQRLLLSMSSGAVTMLDVVLRHPQFFARAAFQSPGWMLRGETGLVSHLDTALAGVNQVSAGSLPPLWFGWGDSETDEWERLSRPNGAAMIAALERKGARISRALVPGGHNLEMYRELLPPAMEFLLRKD